MNASQYTNKVAFAIGTGRCGTQFLSRLLSYEAGVASSHERNALNETFHRYCKWYGLAVDDEGFLHEKEVEISKDLKDNYFSFEASGFLSLSIKELHERLDSKFIFLVRKPEKVIASYLVKGWFENEIIVRNKNLALGYQNNKSFHHFLGRSIPIGSQLVEWEKFSRVGKIGWYWNELNSKILTSLQSIPRDRWMIQRIEDLDYDSYLSILSFLGINSKLSPRKFKLISADRHSYIKLHSASTWNQKERDEFESNVFPMAKRLGYEYSIENILSVPEKPMTPIRVFSQKLASKISKIALRLT